MLAKSSYSNFSLEILNGNKEGNAVCANALPVIHFAYFMASRFRQVIRYIRISLLHIYHNSATDMNFLYNDLLWCHRNIIE